MLESFSWGWKAAGIILGLLGLGASGFAVTVSSKLDTHASQADSLLVEVRTLREVAEKQLCITVGERSKISCLSNK